MLSNQQEELHQLSKMYDADDVTEETDFSYAYSFQHRMRPRVDINRPAGSLGRSQARYARAPASILLERQEKDGSWWDYPLYDYHQAYGTGYALMALAWCRDALKP